MQGQQSILFGTGTSPVPQQPVTTREKKTAKPRKVSRGKGLKRHPARPPVVKRVVKSKPVAMKGHPDLIGDIVDRDGDTLFIVWRSKGDKVYMHNARFMVSVDADKE